MNSPFPLSPPQKAIESLLALRDYYAPLVEEYEKLYTLAKANLTHVEALLSNWSLTEEVDNDNEEFTSEKGKNFFLFLSEESVNDDVEPITHPLLDDSQDTSTVATQLLDSTQQNIFTLIQAWSGEESDAATDSPFLLEPPIETSTQQRPQDGTETDMLPIFQSLSRPEAIEQVLAQHIGTIVHIDFIVKMLYGELEPDAFKLIKSRVQSSLTHGLETNKWFSVPTKPGCYTLSLTLLPKPETKNSSTRVKGKNKKQVLPPQPKDIPMLKEFQGQFLIDALTTFLENNSGKVFGVSEIINRIYGELTATEIKEVKNKVLNELSRGHRTGRFTRVPEQIGFYTWDLELLNK
ncbi:MULTISPECIES: hypothetical protein [Nostoc]|uniref:Uncharacterized protein n=2 Tax=Nostoc TaxID=1177 RepID=A0ABR8IK80_9NOSO|nr:MULTISPECIES: hypothetical protein [Nostoc]MBD2565395.1 hypothetical protein [Nostoc linckia FACHB-391]MBD2651153.1 hypothetical protein [Nostoc foliaceum FACHB-393]